MYSMGMQDVSKMPGKTSAAGLSYQNRDTRSYPQSSRTVFEVWTQ